MGVLAGEPGGALVNCMGGEPGWAPAAASFAREMAARAALALAARAGEEYPPVGSVEGGTTRACR